MRRTPGVPFAPLKTQGVRGPHHTRERDNAND